MGYLTPSMLDSANFWARNTGGYLNAADMLDSQRREAEEASQRRLMGDKFGMENEQRGYLDFLDDQNYQRGMEYLTGGNGKNGYLDQASAMPPQYLYKMDEPGAPVNKGIQMSVSPDRNTAPAPIAPMGDVLSLQNKYENPKRLDDIIRLQQANRGSATKDAQRDLNARERLKQRIKMAGQMTNAAERQRATEDAFLEFDGAIGDEQGVQTPQGSGINPAGGIPGFLMSLFGSGQQAQPEPSTIGISGAQSYAPDVEEKIKAYMDKNGVKRDVAVAKARELGLL